MRATVPGLLLAAALLAVVPSSAALGAPGLAVAPAPCGPACAVAEGADEAADALALPAPPVAPPVVVVEPGPVPVHLVQPVLAPLLEPLAPSLTTQRPTPEDVAALEARVEPLPQVQAPVPPPLAVQEPFVFPRDEPVPPEMARPIASAAPVSTGPGPAVAPAAREEPAAPEPALAAAAGAMALVGWALYVRLAPAALLESPTRRRVFEAVRTDPGCTVGTIARALGLDYKTVQHHLRLLKRAGFVQARVASRQERYFAAGELPEAGFDGALALRSPSARALASALRRGRARASELARALGISEATASVQLRRLEAAGLAARGSDGLWGP